MGNLGRRLSFSSSWSVVIWLLIAACATQADLEQVHRDLKSEIATATARTQSDLMTVRDKTDAVQSRTQAALEAERKVIEALQSREEDLERHVEALTSKVAVVNHGLQGEIADLRKAVQEANAQRAEDLTALHGTVTDVQQTVLRTHERLSTLRAQTQRWESVVRTLAATLLRHNQSEAEALRQRLRELELLTKELDAGGGSSSQASGPPQPLP